MVQCAALVQTNHGIVNLIMNEYAFYDRGHSIHSSGQIEWYTNTVDDKSVQVGGQKRIVTIDGYSMPLVTKIYKTTLLFILQVLMNGIHLYLIMYTQRTMGSLTQLMIELKNFKLIQQLMNLMIISTITFNYTPNFINS